MNLPFFKNSKGLSYKTSKLDVPNKFYRIERQNL